MSENLTKTGVVVSIPVRPNGPACLVMIYGRELGKRWMLDGPGLVLGRGDNVDVILDMDNVSRRHCEIRLNSKGSHIIEDLRSTNGTFVNGEEIKVPRELKSGDYVKVGGTIFKYLDGESLETLFHEEIYRMTIVDGLTQAYNKRFLLEFLEREMSRAHRYARALSVMMMDLDHFKRINDSHGHIAGDHVLREVAGTIKGMVRREECFARYGGEEFALVLPEAERAKVLVFAEKIRATVAAKAVAFEDRTIPVTLSIGVGELTRDLTDPLAFLQSADEFLYRAKNEGRNRVCA